MQAIPLNLQTLYADLQQQVETASRDEATVVANTIGGIRYLRLQRWVGASRAIEHLGRADDPQVMARAEAARAEMVRRSERRRLVSALRRLMPGPTGTLGKVLDAVPMRGCSGVAPFWSERRPISATHRWSAPCFPRRRS